MRKLLNWLENGKKTPLKTIILIILVSVIYPLTFAAFIIDRIIVFPLIWIRSLPIQVWYNHKNEMGYSIIRSILAIIICLIIYLLA